MAEPGRDLCQMQVVCVISLQENKSSKEKKIQATGNMEARKLAYNDVVKVCEQWVNLCMLVPPQWNLQCRFCDAECKSPYFFVFGLVFSFSLWDLWIVAAWRHGWPMSSLRSWILARQMYWTVSTMLMWPLWTCLCRSNSLLSSTTSVSGIVWECQKLWSCWMTLTQSSPSLLRFESRYFKLNLL